MGSGGRNESGVVNRLKIISGITAEPLKAHRFEGVHYDMWSFVMTRNLKVVNLWEVIEKGFEREEGESGPTLVNEGYLGGAPHSSVLW